MVCDRTYVLLALVAVGVLTALLSAPALAQPGPAPINLSWRFHPGDQQVLTVTESFAETTTDRGQSLTQERDVRLTYEQTVTSVEANPESGGQIATLRLAFLHAYLETRSSLYPTPQRFDTAREEDLQRAETDMALRPYAALISDRDAETGAPSGPFYTLQVTSRGEVLSASGFDALLDRVFHGLEGSTFTTARAALERQFGNEAMRQTLAGLYHALPNQAMRPGESWQRSLAQDVPYVGSVTVEQAYTLASVENTPNGRLAEIRVSATYRTGEASAEGSAWPGAGGVAGFVVSGRLLEGTVTGTIRVLFGETSTRLVGTDLQETFRFQLSAYSEVDPALRIEPETTLTGTVLTAETTRAELPGWGEEDDAERDAAPSEEAPSE